MESMCNEGVSDEKDFSSLHVAPNLLSAFLVLGKWLELIFYFVPVDTDAHIFCITYMVGTL